jgi:Ca2+-binding EF-hand superfamily protein
MAELSEDQDGILTVLFQEKDADGDGRINFSDALQVIPIAYVSCFSVKRRIVTSTRLVKHTLTHDLLAQCFAEMEVALGEPLQDSVFRRQFYDREKGGKITFSELKQVCMCAPIQKCNVLGYRM